MHDSVSYLKCCESLSFLVRDVVHVTPENFSLCVGAIRTFVEASYRLLVNNKQNIYLTIIVSLPEEKASSARMVGSYVSLLEQRTRRRLGTRATRQTPLERRAQNHGVRPGTMRTRVLTRSWWASTRTPPCSCSTSWPCSTRRLSRCTPPGRDPPLNSGTRPGAQSYRAWQDFAAIAGLQLEHRP